MRESIICIFYGFWGDFAYIGKSFRNPLRSRLKHKNPNSQLSRPQIKISSLHPPRGPFGLSRSRRVWLKPSWLLLCKREKFWCFGHPQTWSKTGFLKGFLCKLNFTYFLKQHNYSRLHRSNHRCSDQTL